MSNGIRFSALKFLLADMNRKELIITTFPFAYNGKDFFVILTRYIGDEIRPQHAVAKLEFYNPLINQSLFAYANWYEVCFLSVGEFMNFFGIQNRDGKATMRDIFISFSEHFSKFIPSEVQYQNQEQKIILSNRLESNKPNALYCYDIRRNGFKEDGQRGKRSIENSNKAQYLRPSLYEKYKDEPHFSFYFSDNPDEEKTDGEIIAMLAKRN